MAAAITGEALSHAFRVPRYTLFDSSLQLRDLLHELF
jgi:hypothetical protein